MPWFKVDDQLAFNAKVIMAGNEAMGLWVRAGSWSSAQLTDGFIPEHMATAMANGMASECGADALVACGLWERVDGGYQFHDWSDFQPSAAAERDKRKKRSEAGRLGAEARWGSKADGKCHGKTDGEPMADECEVDAPSRPVPSHLRSAPDGDAFDRFWAEYPKKVAKKGARAKWDIAVRTTDPEVIINGARAYAKKCAVERIEEKFQKSPDGWLKDGRWDDEIEIKPVKAEYNPWEENSHVA